MIKYQTATTKTSLDKLMLGCTFYMFMGGGDKNMAASLQGVLEGLDQHLDGSVFTNQGKR